MADEMTIGQLAEATGMAVSTIRFYERTGLLRPSSRSAGNYRLYGREAAERLAFIGAAHAAGFGLQEISAILAVERGRVPCGQASRRVAACLASVRERMLRLRQVDQVLQKIQRSCAGQADHAPCRVLRPFALRRWRR
jgi:DNA-binding transcriptional MerR regulator